jgi:glucose-6-phosphate 1-dehydrogenase
MIDRLAIFGATGDLSGRFLLPALAALHAMGSAPYGLQVTCTGRQPWSTDEYRGWAAAQLDEHAAAWSPDARRATLASLSYRSADISDPAAVAEVTGGDGPVAAYLALPPAVFPTVVQTLHRAGLPPGSRIVLEKPFGEDLESAAHLNRLLAQVLPEQSVFRVDHFLAMTTVQNVLGSRLANRILEPVWNSAHIAEVEIVWEETLALEGRASYYDGVGALRDMVQNHLLQLMCFVAMEPPLTVGERDLRDRKLDVLRAIRPLGEEDVRHHTRRGRYTSGNVDGHQIPSYVDEAGVDRYRSTETFAEVVLQVDNWRWSGTTFRLRTGKGFQVDRKEVAVHFRHVPYLAFGEPDEARPNVLRFGLEPESMALELVGTGPRPRTLVPFTLTAQTQQAALPPYGRLLLDVLSGDATLSIRGDEAEEAWRVLTPVLSAWEKDLLPMFEYPAGSAGPPLVGG